MGIPPTPFPYMGLKSILNHPTCNVTYSPIPTHKQWKSSDSGTSVVCTFVCCSFESPFFSTCINNCYLQSNEILYGFHLSFSPPLKSLMQNFFSMVFKEISPVAVCSVILRVSLICKKIMYVILTVIWFNHPRLDNQKQLFLCTGSLEGHC